MRKPFILNNLDMRETLMDRRKVYDLLEASGIDTPRHVAMDMLAPHLFKKRVSF